MKKLKISMLALLFTVGAGGAMMQKIHAAPKPVDTFYNWIGTADANSHPSLNLSNSTVSTAEDYYGCNTGSTDCADGTKVSGPGNGTAQIAKD